jgi:hypothetical protein
MNGCYTQYLKQRGCGRVAEFIEREKARQAEDCTRRLALLTNGTDPATVERLVPRRGKRS